MASLPPQDELALATAKLTRWRNEADRLAQDRRNLRILLLAGPALGLVVWFLTKAWLWGAAVLALALTAFGMGLYMTAVRRQEYDYQIEEAKAELAAWQRLTDAAGPVADQPADLH